jgi:1D-myo-inositol 3-kinase
VERSKENGPVLRFAAVGHVTNDLLDSGPQPGGSALYAGLAAAALGAEAIAVTRCAADFSGGELLASAGVRLEAGASPCTSTFENRYHEGRREERLLARAEPLGECEVAADVVLACPVIGEVDLRHLRASARVLGAGLQGWLRQTDAQGRIVPARLADVSPFARCQAVFLSEHDVEPGDDLIARLVARCEVVVVTRGSEGARLFVRGVPHHIPALPTHEVDPTGAGDVFAAAFLLALAHGRDPLEAAIEGTCAASVAIEAPGPTSLQRLTELPARLARYAHEVPPPSRER